MLSKKITAAADAPPIFLQIGGMPRSGTTLVTDLLNEDPRISLFSEYVIDDVLKMTSGLLNREAELYGFPAPPIGGDPIGGDPIDGPCSPPTEGGSFSFITNDDLSFPLRFPTRARYAEIMRGIFAAALGKSSASVSVIGSKDPFFALHHDPEFVERMVGARPKYIFTVRNPFWQINSSLNRRNRSIEGQDQWHIGNVDDAINEYWMHVQLIMSFISCAKNDVLLIKYEDIIEKNYETMNIIYDFLGIPFDGVLHKINLVSHSNNIMTPEETAKIRDAFGGISEAWHMWEITGSPGLDTALAGLLPARPSSFSVDLHPLIAGRPLLGTGWTHCSEPDGFASTANDASFVFAHESSGSRSVMLRLSPRFGAAEQSISAAIFVNGAMAARIDWQAPGANGGRLVARRPSSVPTYSIGDGAVRVLDLGIVEVKAREPVIIRFSITSDGSAMLAPGAGIKLHGIDVSEAPPAPPH